ncbi:MAG: hypothetical protein MJZ38_07060 [archaeon]|nr:hypothetical protein [archaeon]
MHCKVIVPSEVPPGSIMTCSRCAYKWAIRKRGDIPKNCPKCRSTLWMKEYHNYTCARCEHTWGTANDSPQRCPKCHTSKWNVPAVQRPAKSETVVSKLDPALKERIYGLYYDGKGGITIAIEMGLAFGDVMDALCEKFPGDNINL